MAKQTNTKNQKSMEEILWDTANKLRGSVESSEYKHIVLMSACYYFYKIIKEVLSNFVYPTNL